MNFVFALGDLLIEMAPWLLFGFFVAGVLHVFVPRSIFRKFLAGNSVRSVFFGALLGVPLPLCSCGVIPTAMGLRKDGASRGASVSFLISTPQTGADSIFATWALLGLPFALIRPCAAFATGIIGGLLVNWLVPEDKAISNLPADDEQLEETYLPQSFPGKIWEVFRYGFGDMMRNIGLWLTIGLILAAFITVLIPDDFLLRFSETPWLGMLAILALASAMYVCATGSIPIAAALMMKGISPGAAFILLMAGPATNLAAMLVVRKGLGRKTFWIYLLTILSGALLTAIGIDFFCPREWFIQKTAAVDAPACCRDCSSIWELIKIGSAIFLVLLLLRGLIAQAVTKRVKAQRKNQVLNSEETKDKNKMNMNESKVYEFRVTGMTCTHCRSFVEKSIKLVSGVETVKVDLASGIAEVSGSATEKEIIQAVEEAGFGISVI